MYGHTEQLNNVPNHFYLSGDEDTPTAVEDSMGNSHSSFEAHALEDGGIGGFGGVEFPVPSNSVYSAVDGGGANQLTLSFRGQVYVFDAVTTEKHCIEKGKCHCFIWITSEIQLDAKYHGVKDSPLKEVMVLSVKIEAVFLLLGACELPSPSSIVELEHQTQRHSMEYTSWCNDPQRAASLRKYRQKRKERCFEKKIRYNVRQEVAFRMQRKKGQFVSSKKSEGSDCQNAVDNSVHDDIHQETSCSHCCTSSKSTPMMRRGPNGPKTLCNACGLFWASRGTLRNLSKKFDEDSPNPIAETRISEFRQDGDCKSYTNPDPFSAVYDSSS